MVKVHDLADLLQGITEHVHQNDAAALRHGQAHEGPQAGGRSLTLLYGARGVDESCPGPRRNEGIPPGATTKKVKRSIVGDSKQPAFRMRDGSRIGERFDRLDGCFLEHILAIDD